MGKPIITATLLIAAIAGATSAGEPRLEIPAGIVLERFSVSKGEDCLLVPVRIAGKDRRFVVDTGSSCTVLDKSLCQGERLAFVRATTPGSDVDLNLYMLPEAQIGGLRVGPLDFVGGYDLKPASQAAGYRIEGILGMDFLSKHVVHIDFDQGVLLLLKSVPINAGESIEIAREAGSGLPLVIGEPARDETMYFVIDTRDSRPYSGSLISGGAKNMASRRGFRMGGRAIAVDLSGESRFPLWRGELFKVDEFSVRQPLFGEQQAFSSLGLGFWSRFIVTFDFPNRKVYLRKGDRYSRRERADLSVRSE